MTEERCRPTGLDLQLGEQVLEVTWADGVKSRFPAAVLRRNCPCAQCRTEREQREKAWLHEHGEEARVGECGGEILEGPAELFKGPIHVMEQAG